VSIPVVDAPRGPEVEAGLAVVREALRGVLGAVARLRGRDSQRGPEWLGYAQFGLLHTLAERGELAAGELAAAAELSAATVTQLLDQLAARGLVVRSRSPRDRRVVVSALTPEGLAQLEAKRHAWAGRWERALADVPAEDLAATARVLGRLRAMIDEAAEEAPQPMSTSPKSSV
jgi:DNA-binding MarR family transcriptional regulator